MRPQNRCQRVLGTGFKQGHYTYFGTLLEGGVRDEETGQYWLRLNPDLAQLFDAGWTALDWQQRQQLRPKPLALWLHGYLGSHAAPFPVTVAYLHKLSGSNTKSRRYFKKNLSAALKELEGIGAIRSFEMLDFHGTRRQTGEDAFEPSSKSKFFSIVARPRGVNR